MTTTVKLSYVSGNKAVAILDNTGKEVARLEKTGDEHEVLVHGDAEFCVAETGDFK